ncbi:MAG: hypothetical protein KTR18_03995 [Acidiferrobacterales bacterium]|nr:hypothetical protein [Acidiferrobacterales bacterium]
MRLFSTSLVTNKNATWLVDNEVQKAILKLPAFRNVQSGSFTGRTVALDISDELFDFINDDTDCYDTYGVHYVAHDQPDYDLIDKRVIAKEKPKNGAHPSGLDPNDYRKEKGWTGVDGMARRIVYFMLTNENPAKRWHPNYNKFYDLYTGPGECNIIYIANCNQDWKFQKDTRNKFEDQRIILKFKDGREPYFDFYQYSTVDPGTHWTKNRMNAAGAAQVVYGQQIGWVMGFHNYKSNHPALINSSAGRPIAVARDNNEDFERRGDKVYTGYFFCNQHHGWGASLSNIGRTSAGCLVGASPKLHKEFIDKLKADPRYKASHKRCWTTTIIPMEFLAAGENLPFEKWT